MSDLSEMTQAQFDAGRWQERAEVAERERDELRAVGRPEWLTQHVEMTERAEAAEALVHQLGEALDSLIEQCDADTGGDPPTVYTRPEEYAALAAYHQFLGEGSGANA